MEIKVSRYSENTLPKVANVSIYPTDFSIPVEFVAVAPEGVDVPDEEWYVLNNTPQWVVDAVVESLRPIVDAYTNRFPV